MPLNTIAYNAIIQKLDPLQHTRSREKQNLLYDQTTGKPQFGEAAKFDQPRDQAQRELEIWKMACIVERKDQKCWSIDEIVFGHGRNATQRIIRKMQASTKKKKYPSNRDIEASIRKLMD